jgi:hypothetical protein
VVATRKRTDWRFELDPIAADQTDDNHDARCAVNRWDIGEMAETRAEVACDGHATGATESPKPDLCGVVAGTAPEETEYSYQPTYQD